MVCDSKVLTGRRSQGTDNIGTFPYRQITFLIKSTLIIGAAAERPGRSRNNSYTGYPAITCQTGTKFIVGIHTECAVSVIVYLTGVVTDDEIFTNRGHRTYY